MISEKKLKEILKPVKDCFGGNAVDLMVETIKLAGFNEQRDCLERGKDATL